MGGTLRRKVGRLLRAPSRGRSRLSLSSQKPGEILDTTEPFCSSREVFLFFVFAVCTANFCDAWEEGNLSQRAGQLHMTCNKPAN